MKVSQEKIDKILSPYNPAVRMLKSAFYEYPKVLGKFVINPSLYHSIPIKHASDIEIQFCLNQLSYVAISEALSHNDLEQIKGLDFDSLKYEHMLIIQSKKRFRRQIPINQEISGELFLKESRMYNGLFISYLDFQFEKKSCTGNLELVLINENNRRF